MNVELRRILSLLLSIALVFSLAACAPSAPSAEPEPNPTHSEPLPTSSAEPSVTPSVEPDPSPSVQPSPEPSTTPSAEPSAEPSPTPSQEPSPEPTPEIPVYQFGTPLAQGETVPDESFENAVFLGDSRTEGLQLFGGLYYGDYFWARGMTVFYVDDPNYAVFEIDGEKLTMIQALSKKVYDLVYIMVGINELGYPASSYESGLRKFVTKVLEVQPDAVVYLQTLPPVNEEVAKKSGIANYINNTNVNAFNAAIVRIAEELNVVLLDTAEVYRDETGSLPADMASDGCHFNISGYKLWTDYLRTHVIDPELYYYSRQQAQASEAPQEVDPQ